eukprot:a508876_287.p1 GENE.a508876_287~~a508876_287.p1  ORF type:complete len:380 (-),score=133.20 a508876_287:21-1136(-)
MAADAGRRFRISLTWDERGTTRTFSEVLDDPEKKIAIGKRGDFIVKGTNVDDKHCLIRLDSKGSYYVMDNGSETGTFFSNDDGKSFVDIGNATVSRNDRKRQGKTLQDNNIIRIGDQDIRVQQVVELTILMPNRQLLLQVINPDGSEEPKFLMQFRTLTIGRKSTENPKDTKEFLAVKDAEKKVSREHCKVYLERKHRIEDVSTLGTFVKRGPVAHDQIFSAEGWVQVAKRERSDLNVGDIIRLADAVYIRVMDPTENAKPPAPPTNFRLADRTTTTLRLEWSPPPMDGSSMEIKAYRLMRIVGEKSEPCWGGNATSWEVQDLEPNTEYTFHVLAHNDLGFSEPSEPLRVRTAAAAIDTDDTASQLTVVRE